MKYKVSKRDWETISAYLDGQLSTRKQVHLESRLQSDNQLRNELEGLRSTRDLLRNTPSLRVPRSFTLTPEMAGQPFRLPRLAPVFGWASAVASFLLVLVLVGDFLNASRIVPISSNILEQQEYSQPRSEFIAEDISVQPSAVENAELPLKGSAEDDELSERSDERVPTEAVGVTLLESTLPQDEPIAETLEIEGIEAAEVPVIETPGEQRGATSMNEAGLETPIKELGVDTENGTGDGHEESESMIETESTDMNTAVSEPFDISPTQEQPIDVTSTSEKTTKLLDEPAGHPPEDAAGTLPAVDTQENQVDPLLADSPKAQKESEITPVEVMEAPLAPAAEESNSESSIDIAFGAEVLLALFAIGTGLAWLYIRSRS